MGQADDEITTLLRKVSALPVADATRSALRDRVVCLGLPYALGLARRFHNLGESGADLGQVAAVGLVKAMNRYNPSYDGGFRAYATPTIVGELKRHFRDRGWSVQVPRRYQDLQLRISESRDTLAQRLGRSPTVADVAAHLELGEKQVVEAMVAANGYRSTSLQRLHESDGYQLGAADRGYDFVELRESIGSAVAHLGPREQRIITLRFFAERSQSEIADELGISQVHVSRLLARSLRELRRRLDHDGA